MLGIWTENHYIAWKNRKKLDFNNEPLLDYKYDSGRFFAANTDAPRVKI